MTVLAICGQVGAGEWEPGAAVGLDHAGPVEEAAGAVALRAARPELALVHVLVAPGAGGLHLPELE